VKEFYAAGEITLTSDQLDRLNEESAQFHSRSGTGFWLPLENFDPLFYRIQTEVAIKAVKTTY